MLRNKQRSVSFNDYLTEDSVATHCKEKTTTPASGKRFRRFKARMDEEVYGSSPPPTTIITRSGKKITTKFQQLSSDDDSDHNSDDDCEAEISEIDVRTMDEVPDGVIQPRKKVEVYYIPDSLIENIITHSGNKTDPTSRTRRNRRINPRMDQDDLGVSPPLSTRMTRSGRKITSKFQQLSLNDNSSDCKSNDVPEPEMAKPEVVPGTLFENNDVDGKEMFSFRTPKRQNGMANKASEVAAKNMDTPRYKSSKSIWTPNSVETKSETSKTPYSLRNQIRKRLVDEAAKQELDRLLEDSGSDYVPTSSSESESSDSDDDVIHHSEDDEPLPTPPKKPRQQVKDYVFTSEDYFDRRYSKIMTSAHTLKKLKTPRLAHSQLTALLKAIPATHKKSMDLLFRGIASSFKHWLFVFSEGFNILLYGLGSKRNILESFRNRHLQGCNVIHINGYFPDNSIKKILDAIVSEFLGVDNIPTQPHEVLELIEERLSHKYAKRIFILVANLDGKAFQNDKSQAIFAQLARIEKVHLVVTVDHINSALLWDHSKLSAFNFIWEDCSNYEPYLDETSYEGSLMVNWSGGLALASLKNVFNSLTVNSRKVFKILLEHHFENKNGKHMGMHFSELYRLCREGFIVSSDLALRTLLTEFTDHELVRWKKDTDHLLITLDQNVLKQFREEINLDK